MGAAKFLHGLALAAGQERLDIVVNTGDDETFYGLHVSPDLDTVVYTLAGVVNRKQGWGLAGDKFTVLKALEPFYGKAWFQLGDRDLATHVFRTERMRAGVSLAAVTAEIARKLGVRARVMPMSNDSVQTFVKLRGRPPIPFQEYFVRRRFRGSVERIELRGSRRARPLRAALAAIRHAGAVIVAPSNPFVSIGPILAVPGMAAAIRAVRRRVAAISPIVAGRAVKGPADRMLRGLGHEPSALGVARLYQDMVGTFVLDNLDRAYAPAVEALGMRPVVADTIMTTPGRAAQLAQVVMKALAV